MFCYLALATCLLQVTVANSIGGYIQRGIGNHDAVIDPECTSISTHDPSHLASSTIARKINAILSTSKLEVSATASSLVGTSTSLSNPSSVASKTRNSTVIIATSIIPTSTPTQRSALVDLSSSITNQGIGLFGVPLNCVNCSTYGNLEVTAGTIRFDDNIVKDIENGKLSFTEGIFKAELPSGFRGHTELSLGPVNSFSHTFTLLDIPVCPLCAFVIPEVGSAGVTFSINIPLVLTLDRAADITFGFDFSIPPGSYIEINIADLENSTMKGFTRADGAELNALPVNISLPNLDMKFSAALQFELKIGMNLFSEDAVVLDVGLDLDLPKLTFEESQVDNVDHQCNLLGPTGQRQNTSDMSVLTNSTRGSVNVNESHILIGDYTNIKPFVGVNARVFAEAGLNVIDTPFSAGVSTGAQLFSTAWPLPTTCIDNHRATSTSTSTISTLTAISHSTRPTLTAPAVTTTSEVVPDHVASLDTGHGVASATSPLFVKPSLLATSGSTKNGIRGSAVVPLLRALYWLVVAS